jgi:trehalose/maltose transport system substrate-binding protein
MNAFDSGGAAFNRLWLGTSVARSGPSSQVYWRGHEVRVSTGFTRIPGGLGGSAGTLGGSGLAVSRHSAHPQEAVKLVRFLFHTQIESIEKRRNASGVQPMFHISAPSEKSMQGARVVHRPSIETGSKYEQVSAAYVAAVRSVLTGQKEAPEAAAELERQLMQITGYRSGPPRVAK